MANYFTEKLVESGVDISNIFPEKQEIARESVGVTYTLPDIVLYLKNASNNFKVKETYLQDLDSAIEELVKKYYKSIAEPNPFEVKIDALKKGFKSKTPRESYLLDDGKTSIRETPKAAPEIEGEVTKADLAKGFKQKDVTPKVTTDEEKMRALKAELERRKEIYLDVYDEEERAEFLDLMKAKMEAHELIADESTFSALAFKVYEDYIKELENIK